MNAVRVLTILAALAVAPAGYAGELRGMSFLDYAGTSHVEEPLHFLPATFPGPLASAIHEARGRPATGSMLLASFGLMLYLGSRRQRALAASR